jgi:hypothetical protein
MTDSRVALGVDRLPWLPDEPARASKRSSDLLGWALAALVLVAGASFWLGTRTAPEQPIAGSRPQPSATVPLPESHRIGPAEEVRPVPAPEAQRVAPPEIRQPQRIGSAPVQRLPRTVPPSVAARVKRTVVTEQIDRVSEEQGAPAKAAPAPAAKPVAPAVRNTQNVKLWPAYYSAGATGRVVQIGAFGTRPQAKLGWRHMARAYPGVRRLPAVVVETRNSRGRPFYRFQIGTTSQAHSEVLCQRMQKIRFSCAVVGLPGARKAVER